MSYLTDTVFKSVKGPECRTCDLMRDDPNGVLTQTEGWGFDLD